MKFYNKHFKTCLFVFILFIISNATSQNVQAYLATGIAFKEDSSWGTFQETSVLVITDYQEDVITIYSKERQIFNIIEYGETWTDADGDQWAAVKCRDNEGINCSLKVAELHSVGGQNQIYVSYANFDFVYNVRPLR